MACLLCMHFIWRVLCRTPIYHSVSFHSGQQIPMAVAADSALASVAVVSSVGLGQATFSTPSHVQLSGSRASSFEAELERSASRPIF